MLYGENYEAYSNNLAQKDLSDDMHQRRLSAPIGMGTQS